MKRDHTEFLTSPINLIRMLHWQAELNIIYSGCGWKNTISAGEIESAMIKEYSEFLDEVQDKWCWYKKSPDVDRDKAIFELIDFLHFALMLVQLEHNIPDIENAITNRQTEPNVDIHAEDPFKVMSRTLALFIISFEDKDIKLMVQQLRNMIEIGGTMLDMVPGEIEKAFHLKNMRNRERVNGGILKGEYKKEDEVPLTMKD